MTTKEKSTLLEIYMNNLFWSDPHIGVSRASHTTPISRKALQDAVYLQALALAKSVEDSVCLGDLFDTTENSEAVIQQGATIASACRLLLAGNHDLPNRENKLSSLQLLKSLGMRSIVLSEEGHRYRVDVICGVSFVSVPHQLSQELFMQALNDLIEGFSAEEPQVLLLHCNYDSPFISDTTSLNLTKDNAERLLTRFSHILIGHEHTARSDLSGRVQLLGNTHPTSFSDISDKFSWSFKVEGGKLSFISQLIWSKAKGFKELSWEILLAGQEQTDASFIDITGVAPVAKLPEIAKAIQKLWQVLHNPYMIRNNVKVEREVIEAGDVQKSLNIPARISLSLKDSPLLPLWEDYLKEVQ